MKDPLPEPTLPLSGFAASLPAGEAPCDEEAPRPADAQPGGDLSRYESWGVLGEGGMGQVVRAYDRRLGIVVAMKFLKAEFASHPAARQRFLAEAATTARLEHPGIVPVYDRGITEDGRLWYTMRRVAGRTLDGTVKALAREELGREASRRRIVDYLLRATEAVAFAHAKGVIHRDLKPANIMVGAFGEVLVLDWGLARAQDLPDWVSQDEAEGAVGVTIAGSALGTPGFMPPEQANGELDAVGTAADVFALGASLHALLTGKVPARESEDWRLAPHLDDMLPGALGEIIARCLAEDPARRPGDATELARSLRDWMEGARRQAEAMSLVHAALALRPQMQSLRDQAALEERRAVGLSDVPSFAPIAQKRPSWEAEDRAAELRHRAQMLEVTYVQRLRAALSTEPSLRAAHDLLADYHQMRLIDAERRADGAGATEHEALLRGHASPDHTRWLDGQSWVSLLTDVAAEVVAHRWVQVDRRWIRGEAVSLGPTPLRRVALSRGRYQLQLVTEDGVSCELPVWLRRGAPHDDVDPSGQATLHRLPRSGELDADQVWIAGGWTLIGGDAAAMDSMRRRRVWVDAFVLARHPVTVGTFEAFLEHLRASGEGDRAEALRPAPGTDPDLPMTGVDWSTALEYARWRGARLPTDIEWEKAARGVDGRSHPWGDHFDATWTRCIGSHDGVPSPVPPTSLGADRSPYGVCGMAGNTRDWCLDNYDREGITSDGERHAVRKPDLGDPSSRACRGGSFASTPVQCRSATRFGAPPSARFATVGIRLAWDWPP